MGFRFKAKVLVTSLAFTMVTSGLLAQPYMAEDKYFVVQQTQAVPNFSLGGTVVPYKEITLSAQLPGRVNFLAGIEGDIFKESDRLVELDDSELLAKRQAALAQLANADVQLRNAGVQYNRELWSPKSRSSMGGMGVPNLFDQMFTHPMGDAFGDRGQGAERSADIYSSRTNIQQAQNTIYRVQAEIRAIDAKMRDAKSLSPFDGVIMRKFVEVGDTVQPGQPLLKYADVEYLQIVVDVPGRLRPGLNEGMMLRAELDVGDREVPVRVAQIFPMADAQRHTVTIKFDLPQGVSAPGMYAKVLVPDFNAPARSNPIIPNSAIRYNGSLPGVYVEGDDNEAMLRLIRVGEKLPGDYSTVLSGLQVGERVLRNPPLGISAGWTSPQR
ncbi:MAG: efflux RND transporter periplasmic adaptor subunit [Candidatus Thiodiazotropha sp. (ex Lucinoma aequizonata)]|nr:efflux RND transporter periplasmic adaptor subunit [Candidatus Thiodiazotropha sp. (ex Lucinoma aequizonata)]MCU7888604.1 efflux RND transporter periplasmic adaptor subunit [Candidatus Thiodiazotropha sp. (ex Lucinoma aequizonata)]MCU7893971.1 efflux RND transporter periplasmic adaptor subunit [Candidatus Thiodiazotropha sp. (ex Lucinoma aequizonata)]MCU7898848.1 efflux RND transporter periplasmic adaptor subunit [Candidatus Thiodiazotropha sp. (ex Lucinoma aequizonata)]MCU7902032.1 efflux R